jgi:hypothetical protein
MSASSTMGAGRAGKGTALADDTATNNEGEKPWADKRHFSIIISCYVATLLLQRQRQLFLTCEFLLVLLPLPSLVPCSPCLYY